MAIDIGGYNFEGIYFDPDQIREDAGVYVVLCIVNETPHCILDIGTSGHGGTYLSPNRKPVITETSNLRHRIKSHDRKKCWEEKKHGEIGFAVLYDSDEKEILRIERELQWKFEFACGQNPWKEIEKDWQKYKEFERQFGPRGSWKIRKIRGV